MPIRESVIKRHFRDYFPCGCLIEGSKKQWVFDRALETIKPVLSAMDINARNRMRNTLKKAAPPGLDFGKKYICIFCQHSTCKYRATEIQNEMEEGAK